MTLSLAAVFIPLVLLPGLLGRIFQEFSITIIVAILASGLVSLTLTPLMCAHFGRTQSRSQTRSNGKMDRRFYSARHCRLRSRAGQISRLGLANGADFARLHSRALVFFTHLPFTLLPVGDSGSARGVFIAQEGASPEQMRGFQKQVNEKIIAEPSIGQFFTVAGSAQRSAASQAVIFAVFKPREQRDPIEQCLLRLQKSISTTGIAAVITAQPVLQINVGATNQTQGQYAYTISGIVPDDVYKEPTR